MTSLKSGSTSSPVTSPLPPTPTPSSLPAPLKTPTAGATSAAKTAQDEGLAKFQGQKGKFVVEMTTELGVFFTGLGAGWTVKNKESAQIYKTLNGAARWISKQGYKNARILDAGKSYAVVPTPVVVPVAPKAPKAPKTTTVPVVTTGAPTPPAVK